MAAATISGPTSASPRPGAMACGPTSAITSSVPPVLQMAVAAIAGGVVFHDIAGEHHLGIGHPDDRIARRMGPTGAEDVDAAVAEIDGHRLGKGRGGPCQAGDFLMPFEKARETGELAVPILLPALGDHGARGVGHDDLPRAIGRRAENAHGVVMGEDKVADRLVGDGADAVDDLARKAGVACASTIITLSSPMMTPVLGSPSAVKA
jgi:hypothetical protein